MTTSIFGGHFLPGIVSGGTFAAVSVPGLGTFLTDTWNFFSQMFLFGVAGAEVFSPLWILMGIIELIILANFLRTGIT